jgi:hypothetical protein
VERTLPVRGDDRASEELAAIGRMLLRGGKSTELVAQSRMAVASLEEKGEEIDRARKAVGDLLGTDPDLASLPNLADREGADARRALRSFASRLDSGALDAEARNRMERAAREARDRSKGFAGLSGALEGLRHSLLRSSGPAAEQTLRRILAGLGRLDRLRERTRIAEARIKGVVISLEGRGAGTPLPAEEPGGPGQDGTLRPPPPKPAGSLAPRGTHAIDAARLRAMEKLDWNPRHDPVVKKYYDLLKGEGDR